MIPAVVCGVDQSEGAGKALALAAGITECLGLRLVLVHAAPLPRPMQAPVVAPGAVPSAPDSDYERLLREGRVFLERIGAEEGVDAELRPEHGSPGELLLSVAAEEDAELIVVGSRGRSVLESLLRGSVSYTVAANARCPVLVAPESAPAAARAVPRTVVCGVDDSTNARAGLQAGAALAERVHAELVLVHVAPSPVAPGVSTVPGAGERLRTLEARTGELLLREAASAVGLNAEVGREVLFGTPASVLPTFARDIGADLIVIGSRGRGLIRSALLGSTSAKLLSKAPCAVMTVPREPTASRPDGWFSDAAPRDP